MSCDDGDGVPVLVLFLEVFTIIGRPTWSWPRFRQARGIFPLDGEHRLLPLGVSGELALDVLI